VGEQNSADDVKLKNANKTPAPFGGSDFRDIHRPENGRAANAESADETERYKRTPVPRKGATRGGNDVQNRHPAQAGPPPEAVTRNAREHGDRKSTRLNSSHLVISYAVFCLKKKKRAHPNRFTTT